MTINIPLKAVAFVVYTLALLGGAFGVSYAVFEWRGNGEEVSEYVNCSNDALQTYIDGVEQEVRVRPVVPDSAGAGTSEAALDSYQQRFKEYEKEYEAHLERGDDIGRDYEEEVRACADILG